MKYAKKLKLYEELVRTACGICELNSSETKNAVSYLNQYFEKTGEINLDARTFAYQASTMYISDFCTNVRMNQTELEKEASDLCSVLGMEEQGSKILN